MSNSNEEENIDPPSGILDTSGRGGPFIPRRAAPGLAMAAREATPPSEQELIVEIQLAPGISDLNQALTSSTGLAAASDSSQESELAAVLRSHGLLEARSVFSRERVEQDKARIKARQETHAAPHTRSAPEQLPSLSSYVRLRFPPGTRAAEVISSLKRLPEVTHAVAVPRATPPMPAPTDPLIGADDSISVNAAHIESQWYLHRTRIPPAWESGRGAGVVIADVDWGFLITHQDLVGAIEKTYNAVDGTDNVSDGPARDHGTGVLGIAGARANTKGLGGYAPESKLWAIQGDSGTGTQLFDEPWAEAIDFVVRTPSNGRRKVIMVEVQTDMAGNYEQVPSVHRSIRAAIAAGCVVCVAAGNGDWPVELTDEGEPFEPTGSILVGATAFDANQNKRAEFSNFGARVVVSAPGDADHDVTCGQGINSYRNDFGGTSGATPKVAGTVALMLSVNPDLTHDEVRDILAATGSQVTPDPGRPIGVFLNAEAAVAEALRLRIEAGPNE